MEFADLFHDKDEIIEFLESENRNLLITSIHAGFEHRFLDFFQKPIRDLNIKMVRVYEATNFIEIFKRLPSSKLPSQKKSASTPLTLIALSGINNLSTKEFSIITEIVKQPFFNKNNFKVLALEGWKLKIGTRKNPDYLKNQDNLFGSFDLWDQKSPASIWDRIPIHKNDGIISNQLITPHLHGQLYIKFESDNLIIDFDPEMVDQDDIVELLVTLDEIYKLLGGSELVIHEEEHEFSPTESLVKS